LASDDPKAKLHHRESEYFLAVGLFQTKNYREALPELSKVINTSGMPSQFVADAVYLRFKTAEALYTKDQGPEMAKTYLDAIKDFLNRYPDHKSPLKRTSGLASINKDKEITSGRLTPTIKSVATAPSVLVQTSLPSSATSRSWTSWKNSRRTTKR